MARIIAISNQKGGCGRTTTAINLATAFAECGNSVLAVDFDPQGNLTDGFEAADTVNKNGPSVYDAIATEFPVGEVIVETGISNLDLLPANIDLSGAEIDLRNNRMDPEKTLYETIKDVEDNYDYIIIDTPSQLGILLCNALYAAETVIIPVQTEYYSMVGLAQIRNTINLIKERWKPAIEIGGVVLTMADNSKLSKDVEDSVRKETAFKVYNTVIPRDIRLAEAPSAGMPGLVYDLMSKGSIAYRRLADELLNTKEG